MKKKNVILTCIVAIAAIALIGVESGSWVNDSTHEVVMIEQTGDTYNCSIMNSNGETLSMANVSENVAQSIYEIPHDSNGNMRSNWRERES